MIHHKSTLYNCILLALLLACTDVMSEIHSVHPGNYRTILSQLEAGDELVLQSGTYYQGLQIHNKNGKAGNPIIIRGPKKTIGKAVFIARRGQNTVSIVNSSFINLQQLYLDGRHLPVDAIKAEGYSNWAHHITLQDLTITNYDYHQQKVAISSKCAAWNWVIRGNIIDGAGTGMYLGDSDGSDPFIAGLIENNLIKNTIGYNLQIKHQNPRSHDLAISTEANNTIIRNNTFTKSANSSSAGAARPNVLVGHWPKLGPGKDDNYLIYGNFFYDNPSEALFQGEGNIAFYNNIMVNRYGSAVRIQPHNDEPKNVFVFYNTVLSPTTGINVVVKKNGKYPLPKVFLNVVFASQPIRGGNAYANFVAELASASIYLQSPFAWEKFAYYPMPFAKASFQMNESIDFKEFLDSNRDFNRKHRQSEIAGAYAGFGTNPGSALQLISPLSKTH